MGGLQRALSWVFPAQCILCTGLVEDTGGLCADCWKRTPFLTGLLCDTCGASLPGESSGVEHCDDCLSMSRPWAAGRAALSYRDLGRKIVLSLKHGDRTDLAKPAAAWMERAGRDVLRPGTLLVPVPVHWSRLLRRRYNQSAELVRALSARTGLACCPDALIRQRRTPPQDGMTVDDRFRNMTGAIRMNPRRTVEVEGKTLCLIDDVMTSGATLSASAEALWGAGADQIFVLVLARVEKDT